MEISTHGHLLCCFIVSCFISVSVGDRVYGNEAHHLKLKEQVLRRQQDVVSEHINSPHNIVKRSASKTVDIAMFTDSSPPGKKFSVYVDDTMTRLHIEVKVERSNPVIIVAKPSGPGPFPKLNTTAGTTTATIDVAITAADCGIWHLTKLDANTWNVKVQGESPLDFTYQFLSGLYIKLPITGDPIQDETYTARISVPEYATVQKIDMFLEFVTEKSSPVNMIPPKSQTNGLFDVASIKMLDKDFMIGIQGRDKSGNFLRRITLIKPVAWILSIPTFSAGVKWYENTKLDIPFFVINKMKTDQDIDVKIQDTQGLAEAPKIISATLTPGQNYSGHFVLASGLLGVTTEVTITVSQYLGHGKIKQGPSEVNPFTVEKNQTTTTSTSVSTTSSSTSTMTTTVTSKTTSLSTIVSSSTKPSSVVTTKSVKTAESTTSSSPSASSQVTSSIVPASKSLSSSIVPASKSLSSLHAAASGVSNTSPISTTVGKSATGGSSTQSLTSQHAHVSAAVTSTQSPGNSKSATSLLPSSLAPVSAVTSTLTGGKVSTNNPTSHLNAKSTVQQPQQHAAVSASSASSQTAGKPTTAAPDEDKDESMFSKGEVFGVAIVSGVSAGVLLGVAALVTMGLVFKHSINKRKVTPEEEKKQRTLSEHNELAWT